MKKIKETGSGLLVIILIAALGFVGGYWYHSQKIEDKADVVVDDTTPDVKLPGEKEKSIVTVDEVPTKLVAIGELSTYSGQYTVKKGRDFFRNVLDDIRIPWTTNNVTIECEGIVKVGYDVNEIGVDIDDKSYTIYISLPEATVNDNYVIWDSVICKEDNNPFNPIDFEEYKLLIEEIEEEGLSQSEEQEIYKAAEENIKNIIVNFLSGMDDYQVKFL